MNGDNNGGRETHIMCVCVCVCVCINMVKLGRETNVHYNMAI